MKLWKYGVFYHLFIIGDGMLGLKWELTWWETVQFRNRQENKDLARTRSIEKWSWNRTFVHVFQWENYLVLCPFTALFNVVHITYMYIFKVETVIWSKDERILFAHSIPQKYISNLCHITWYHHSPCTSAVGRSVSRQINQIFKKKMKGIYFYP